MTSADVRKDGFFAEFHVTKSAYVGMMTMMASINEIARRINLNINHPRTYLQHRG